MSNGEVKSEKKKGGKILLILCIIVIAALCVIIYLLLNKKDDDDDKVKRNVIVNEENVEQVLSDIEDRVPAGSYEVVMNTTWSFKDGSASSEDAYVENSTANQNPVYFEVTRSDTEETIYESPIIPVGSHLDEIILDEKLPAGSHDCVVTYHLLDDEEETISTVRVGVTIVIEN